MFRELPLFLLTGDRQSLYYEVNAPLEMPMQTQTGGRYITIAPTHPQPDTRRRRVVNTTLRPLYSWERRGTHRTGDGVSGVPRNFVRGGGVPQIQLMTRGQRERGSGGGSPLVRGSGGSCNLVQEISFHIVKFS